MTEAIKKEIQKNLESKVQDFKKELLEAETSLTQLENMDLNNSKYKIRIMPGEFSLGELNSLTNHKGSLINAIHEAEKDFKSLNSVDEVVGKYIVRLMINNTGYIIPKTHWEQYIDKHNF